MSFCRLTKGITPKIRRLCFVLINRVLLNLLCFWILHGVTCWRLRWLASRVDGDSDRLLSHRSSLQNSSSSTTWRSKLPKNFGRITSFGCFNHRCRNPQNDRTATLSIVIDLAYDGNCAGCFLSLQSRVCFVSDSLISLLWSEMRLSRTTRCII